VVWDTLLHGRHTSATFSRVDDRLSCVAVHMGAGMTLNWVSVAAKVHGLTGDMPVFAA
jgi:hypothetical protein